MYNNGFKRFLVTIVVATGIAALIGCAGMSPKPDFYPQKGQPNTITYTDSSGKEVTVFDLRGKWKASYYGEEIIVIITQKGDRFEGRKTRQNIGGVSTIEKTISGKIRGNKIDCETLNSVKSTTWGISKLSEKVDRFTCPSQDQGSRVYERIE